MSDLKTSLLVNRQVPEFIREEYPLFITFLEAYYEFLEQKQGTQINDLTAQAKQLRYLADVDESIAAFEDNFFNTYANLLPKDVQVDKAFLIKNVLPLYLAKGSEKAFKLLFRMLFNDEVEIQLPKNAVLRASDGKWTVENILKVEDRFRNVHEADGTSTYYRMAQESAPADTEVYVDGVLKTYGDTNDYLIFQDDRWIIFNTPPASGSVIEIFYLNFNPIYLNPVYSGGIKITGLTSGASAIIEKATRNIISSPGSLGIPIEIFISSKTLQGNFINGEELQALVIDPDGPSAGILDVRTDTYSIINRIVVDSKGASYNIGDPVIITGGGAREDATAVVESVVSGVIDSITIVYGGAGFAVGGNVLVNGVFTGNLDIAINDVDTSGVANSTSNVYYVNTDAISNYSSTLISSSDYGFPGTVISTGENVSTVIADALTSLTITNLGPITNVVILSSNTVVSSIPTLDAYGATFTANGTTYSIKEFGSIGRFQINDGGLGYAEGDEIVFGAVSSKSFARGAAAAVKKVAANGAIQQIEIQPSRIAGTVAITNNSTYITGTGTTFTSDLRPGDHIVVNNQYRYILSVTDNTHANTNVNWSADATGKKLGKYDIYPLGGQGYSSSDFPSVTVSSSGGTSANIQIIATMSDGENITPYVGVDPPGAILAIRMLSGGLGYVYVPQIDLTGYGDGTATAHAEIDDVYKTLDGRWLTSDSIISSSERKLQGKNYFLDYSYITSSNIEFSKYKSILQNLLHPTGLINYADLNKSNAFSANTITISATEANTLAGTVAITNNSIYVTGSNTKFILANTRGQIANGTNIAINGIIRTVNNIISNTNISVSSAFTSNATAQTLIILT